MAKIQIFSDSSSDLSKEQRKEYGIEYFRMTITVNDKEYHADLDYEEYPNEQISIRYISISSCRHDFPVSCFSCQASLPTLL